MSDRTPDEMLSPDESRRYNRHLILPEVGVAGQLRLKQARVLYIGAGGLGSPVGIYLAASGVGTIGVVDNDLVEESNLNRQIAHDTASVGRPKSESMVRRIKALNPYVEVKEYRERLTVENVESIFADWDLVLDCSDNFETRYLVNDAAWFAGLPLISGSIFRFEGQVSLFIPREGGACYRCLYAVPPPPSLAPN